MNARIDTWSTRSLPLPPLSRDERRLASRHLSVEEGAALLLPDLVLRARQLTRSEAAADDLVQDTVERALRFKGSFHPGGHLRAWLFRIMQNLFISHLRRARTERRIVEDAGLDPNGWAALSPVSMQPGLSPPVEKALGGLPERLREVVTLVDLGEASYRDAALDQKVPIGTIMSRLHRGRARLKNCLNRAEAA
jgi:RNA polymerase sigma-70 factor (ECF subfamily)